MSSIFIYILSFISALIMLEIFWLNNLSIKEGDEN